MPASSLPTGESIVQAGSEAAQRRLLLHCPDITLKGRNQRDFQDALVRNVRHVLNRAGLDWRVGSARGRVYVESTGRDPAAIEQALNVLDKVAGIASLGDAVWLRPADLSTMDGGMNWRAIEDALVAIADPVYQAGQTFAVRVNRVNKRLPVKSSEMEARLGAVLRDRTSWDRVKLKGEDRRFQIDAYPDGLYLYPGKRTGVGGLPVGTGGRAIALLSGGIDSPVAAFMLAKRGCSIDALHLSVSHPGSLDESRSLIARLASRLSRYTIATRLYVVPYTYFDLALSGKPSGYEMVLFRRFLMRCGAYLSRNIDAAALITGDSLGQVASQTMENLAAASGAASMLTLQPLIGLNKQEIIDQARRIGTFDISTEPYKDCCALIATHPRTRSSDSRLALLEQDLFSDYDQMLRDTFSETLCLEFDSGECVGRRIVRL